MIKNYLVDFYGRNNPSPIMATSPNLAAEIFVDIETSKIPDQHVPASFGQVVVTDLSDYSKCQFRVDKSISVVWTAFKLD